MNLTMLQIRENVVARIIALDATIIPDLMNSDKTHDNLIRALDILTAPISKGAGDGSKSYGHKIAISALNRDHSDDSMLGPHSHRGGWAVDIAIIDNVDVGDNHETRQFIRDADQDEKVTKWGTMSVVATRSDLEADAADHGKIEFTDNGTGPHVHLQSSENV